MITYTLITFFLIRILFVQKPFLTKFAATDWQRKRVWKMIRKHGARSALDHMKKSWDIVGLVAFANIASGEALGVSLATEAMEVAGFPYSPEELESIAWENWDRGSVDAAVDALHAAKKDIPDDWWGPYFSFYGDYEWAFPE